MLKTLPYSWTPRDIHGAIIALWASHVDGLRQEQFYTSAAQQCVTLAAFGQGVGTAFLCQEGHIFAAISNAYRPTLQFDASGGRNSFFRFGAGGQPSSLVLLNSTGALRNIHTSQCYQIAFWLRMQTGGSVGGDGVVQSIIDSNNNANTTPGFYIQRESSNQIEVGFSSGSGWLGNVDAGTVTAASGWLPVVVTGRGPGTNTGTIAIGGSLTGGVFVPTVVASYNLAAGAALGTDAGFNLTIGSTAGNSLHGQFDLDNLVITDGPMDPSDLTNWYNFNPSQNSGSLARAVRESAELEPEELSHLWAKWDFTRARHPANDQAMIFQNAAATTPVTASGQTVEYVENWLGTHLKRWLSQSNSAEAPTWTCGLLNGVPGMFFNGSGSGSTTSPNDFNLNQQIPSGDKTIVFVCRQNNNGPVGSSDTGMVGSHLLNDTGTTAAYVAIGGTYHASPSIFQVHPDGDSGFAGTTSSCVTQLTLTATTSPSTAGVYAIDYGTLANAIPTYYCAATGYRIFYTTPSGGTWSLMTTAAMNTWLASSTNPASYWNTGNPSQFGLFTARGSASGNTTPTVSGGNTAIGASIYVIQQKGAQIRTGINGLWSPWVGTLGSLAYNNIGKDGHFNSGSPTEAQHFELNASVQCVLVYNYAHVDHFLNKALRRLGNRFNIQSMTLSQ